MNIQISEKNREYAFSIIEQHFLFMILALNSHDCLTTPESTLSDFCFSNFPPEEFEKLADSYDLLDKTNMTYQASADRYLEMMYDAWDKYILASIFEHYHVKIENTNSSLEYIFNAILSISDIERLKKDIEFFDYPEKIQHHEPKLTLEEKLAATQNPEFYAKHTGVSIEVAKTIIDKRLEGKHAVAYRPIVEKMNHNKFH